MALVYTLTAGAVSWSISPTPPITFSAVPIGAASGDRIVGIAIGVDGDGSNGVISGVTINSGGGAVPMIKAKGQDPTSGSFPVFNSGQYFYIAAVPTGTTADIVVSCSGFPNGVGIVAGKITGDAGATIVGTGFVAAAATADPHTISVAAGIPPGGIGIIVATVDRFTTPTWSGTTNQDANNLEVGGNGHDLLVADTVTASQTLTGAPGFGIGIIIVSFGPTVPVQGLVSGQVLAPGMGPKGPAFGMRLRPTRAFPPAITPVGLATQSTIQFKGGASTLTQSPQEGQVSKFLFRPGRGPMWEQRRKMGIVPVAESKLVAKTQIQFKGRADTTRVSNATASTTTQFKGVLRGTGVVGVSAASKIQFKGLLGGAAVFLMFARTIVQFKGKLQSTAAGALATRGAVQFKGTAQSTSSLAAKAIGAIQFKGRQLAAGATSVATQSAIQFKGRIASIVAGALSTRTIVQFKGTIQSAASLAAKAIGKIQFAGRAVTSSVTAIALATRSIVQFKGSAAAAGVLAAQTRTAIQFKARASINSVAGAATRTILQFKGRINPTSSFAPPLFVAARTMIAFFGRITKETPSTIAVSASTTVTTRLADTTVRGEQS